MRHDMITRILSALALILIAITLLFYVFQSKNQGRETLSGIAEQTQQQDKANQEQEEPTEEITKVSASQAAPQGEKLSLWPPRPEGETDLERIKRLMQALDPGEEGANYLIRVFKDRQMVVVYSDPDSDQSFSKMEHAFICSSAIEPYDTPSGDQQLGLKLLSGYMLDGSYCKYCSEFKKTYYFHAPPSYGDVEEAGVSWKDYNSLGKEASHGCIRLTTRDAKWIFENCGENTKVEILDSSEGYSGLPDQIDRLMMQEGEPSWDPTNDNPANPYQQDPARLLPYNKTN